MILFGVGHVGQALARLAPGCFGTTRDAGKVGALRAIGVEPIVVDGAPPSLESVPPDHGVVVTFPPDGVTDQAWAARCHGRRIVYVSSTGVYGSGIVDLATPTDRAAPRAAARLDAEDAWRACGASVVRAPAIYGPGFGLHERVRRGVHEVPGDGSNVISRIHVDDLASTLVAALLRGEPGAVYLAADDEPAPHGDVVRFICERLGAPFPPSVPIDRVAVTLRGSRRVDARASLATLGVTLRYPTYRDGIAACLDAERAAPNG